MVDDLHGNLARFGYVERPAHGGEKAAPGRCVDVRTQRTFQPVKRFIRASEVGVPHEETFTVVIGVDEPASDVIGR